VRQRSAQVRRSALQAVSTVAADTHYGLGAASLKRSREELTQNACASLRCLTLDRRGIKSPVPGLMAVARLNHRHFAQALLFARSAGQRALAML